MIDLQNVCKTYSKNTPALNNISLHIDDGEFVFITGVSGSGKSTLIRLLLRETKPTSGSIMINGRNIARIPKNRIYKLRREIGTVFQDFRLLEDRDVYDNVAFAQKAVEASNRNIKQRVYAMLSMVDLMGKHKALPKELSGGEQQRVAIARALINKPRILLCDEPTGNLDEANSWEVMKLLENANSQGTTVIVVTHNMEIVNAMRKRTINIYDGSITYDRKGGNLDYEI